MGARLCRVSADGMTLAMRPFAYHRAQTVADAVALLAERDEAMPLAGGMTLIPAMKRRLCFPTDLVDLADVPGLRDIVATADTVTIGAMTTYDAIARSPDVVRLVPGVAALAADAGDMAVRNRATLGGGIADGGDGRDFPAAVLALGATIWTDRRAITADDFFIGLRQTALAAGELIVRVEFRAAACAYAKIAKPSSHLPVAGVFVVRRGEGPRVAVSGAADAVFRLDCLEAALVWTFAPEVAFDDTVRMEGLVSDVHASADYRAHLVRVMASRAIARLM